MLFDYHAFSKVIDATAATEDEDWLYAGRPTRRLFVPAQSRDVGIMHVEIGAPIMAFVLQLLSACQTKSVYVGSSAGSLSPKFAVGDTFVLDSSFSNNGVLDYAGVQAKVHHASGELIERVRSVTKTYIPEIRGARSLSSDLYFRDGFSLEGELKKFAPELVEMEAATIYAICAKAGMSACVYGVVSDVLGKVWMVDPGRNTSYRATVAELTIALVRSLTGGASV
jgi:purine-nucleoside phosphorylase